MIIYEISEEQMLTYAKNNAGDLFYLVDELGVDLYLHAQNYVLHARHEREEEFAEAEEVMDPLVAWMNKNQTFFGQAMRARSRLIPSTEVVVRNGS